MIHLSQKKIAKSPGLGQSQAEAEPGLAGATWPGILKSPSPQSRAEAPAFRPSPGRNITTHCCQRISSDKDQEHTYDSLCRCSSFFNQLDKNLNSRPFLTIFEALEKSSVELARASMSSSCRCVMNLILVRFPGSDSSSLASGQAWDKRQRFGIRISA